MLRERRVQLDAIIEAVERAEDVLTEDEWQWDAIVRVIRAIQMNQDNNWANKYFNEEQLQRMKELSEGAYSDSAQAKLGARIWTEEDQRRVDAQYNALWEGVRRSFAAGQDPGDPEPQRLAGEAIALIEAFTGGDPEIAAGLNTFWKNLGELPADQQPFKIPLTDAEADFLEQAKTVYRSRA
jgi:MerR family transcriptional regulator, thiopeptide resistance regulator